LRIHRDGQPDRQELLESFTSADASDDARLGTNTDFVSARASIPATSFALNHLPGGLQFMGGVNGAGHVASFAESVSLSSVSLSGAAEQPQAQSRGRRSLY
jgi:hypothetical protein